MAERIVAAYEEDIDMRINGLELREPNGYKVNAHEIQPGVVYKDNQVTVKAFPVKHGSWKHAFGFLFETPTRIVVLSGDCTFDERLIENATGCDVLVHEVYSQAGFAKRPPKWQTYHSDFHTSSKQLAEIANRVKPGLLVLYHQLLWSSTEEELVKEIQESYKGKVVSGHDLDVY